MEDLLSRIEQLKKAIIVVSTASGKRGSGFFVNDRGLFLTNKHVIELRTFVKVILSNDREYEAMIVCSDNDLDIAFGIVNCMVEGVVAIGDSDVLREGEDVIAVGHPYGYDFTITRGIVSCKRRLVKGISYIQSDAAINPGSSGGPLINEKGEVIGITTWAVEGSESMGFAIPINTLRSILDNLNSNFDNLQLMYYCPICGFLSNTFIRTSKGEYCENCGASRKEKNKEKELTSIISVSQAINVASIKCPKCLAINDTTSNFCKKCGYQLKQLC